MINSMPMHSLSEATAIRLFNSVAATNQTTQAVAGSPSTSLGSEQNSIETIESINELENACRICRWNRSEQILRCPCHCRGTVCLKRWIMHRRDNHCEICNEMFAMPDEKYNVRRMFMNFWTKCAGTIMKHVLFGASLLPLAHVVLQQVLFSMENINRSPHQQLTTTEVLIASCALITSSALFFHFIEFVTLRSFRIKNILRHWWTFGSMADFPLIELESEMFDFI